MNLDNERYLGARFHKCDLHMHTPGDAKDWRDKASRVTKDTQDDRRAELAREYLGRCHEAGLEVIGITDHNFAPKAEDSFINDLRNANEPVAQELGRQPLVILPGFEIEANVGKGCHVICLFPEDVELHVVDSRLTACGLPSDFRFEADGSPKPTTKNLSEIIQVIQRTEKHAGLVICAHPFGDKGMFKNRQVEMWLQKEEFKNPDLMCIEIPGPIDELPDGIRKMIVGGKECNPEWRRGTEQAERPIAYISSSDCHRLEVTPEGHSDHIGARYTWIKMSQPSIEALRQAFLDRDSRIRLEKTDPDSQYQHPTITRVEVTGASFYRAEPVLLSPNLNCIIGSRGSGKSTLFDYLRLALDRLREGDLPKRIHEDIMSRINDTLNAESRITVDIETSNIPYRVSYTHANGGERIVSRIDTGEENPDWEIRTLFPVRIISQREIDESIGHDDQGFLVKLLDELIVDELEQLRQRENDVRNRIRFFDIAIKGKRDAQARRSSLITRKTDLEGRIKRLENVRQPLERWTKVGECNRYLRDLLDSTGDFSSSMMEQMEAHGQGLLTVISGVPEVAASGSSLLANDELSGFPETGDMQGSLATMKDISVVLSKAKTIAERALRECGQAFTKAIEQFDRATNVDNAPLRELIESEWNGLHEKEVAEYRTLAELLEKHGDDPEEYLSLKDQLEEVEYALRTLDIDLQQIDDLETQRTESLERLREIWLEQTGARKRKAEELMERLRPTPTSKPYVAIEITHQANAKYMVNNWLQRVSDKRRINELDIRKVNEAISQQSEFSDKPIQDRLIAMIRLPNKRDEIGNVLGSRVDAFFEVFSEDALRELELDRIADKVSYKVYRHDGSLAGPIDNVSVGQKGLAFLSVLLADGEMPVMVDTPEEGLDSEGVYSELVPTFRREKERRQLVIATHNANLPVNADAELVVTLEATGEVDFNAPDLIDEIAAGEENGSPRGRVVSQTRTKSKPNRDSLEVKVKGQNWHKDVEKYLRSKCGWSEDEVSAFINTVADHRQVYGDIRRRSGDGGRHEMALGALDSEQVKRAVQDIMEGSEQAFRKRSEKYGF